MSEIFSGKAMYYGDNDFILRTFDFIARSDTARVWLAVPNTDSHVTCSADADSHVTCSTDMDSRVTCSKKYGFLCSGKAFPLTPIHMS